MAKNKSNQKNYEKEAESSSSVSSANNSNENTEEMYLNFSEKYKGYLEKMDKSDQAQINKALEKFKHEPRSLKMKSLKNICDSATISIEVNGKTVPLRIIAYLEKKGNERALNFFWVGTHPEYDKVIARGYILKSKLESVPSKLYNGLNLSDIANDTNEFKSFVKKEKEEVLKRMREIGYKTDNKNDNYKSEKINEKRYKNN